MDFFLFLGVSVKIVMVLFRWYNRKYLEGKNVAIDDRCATWACK